MSVRRYYVDRRRRKRNGMTHNGLIVGLVFTLAFIAFLFWFVAFMARM